MEKAHDRRPAWVEALPYDAEPERARPTDGFGDGPRHASILSGNEVCYAGKAGELFWLHPSIGRVERMVMLTHLAAHGATRTMGLCGISGMSHKKIGATLRGLLWVGLIESRVVPGRVHGGGKTYPPLAPLADPSLKGGDKLAPASGFVPAVANELLGRRGHPGREWEITEEGRRWVWRTAWVTRYVVCAPCDDLPAREDVAEDPVEAVRTCAERIWLRPNGLALAFYLKSGWRPLSLNRLCRLARMNPGIAQPGLKRLVARGWAEAHPTEQSVDAAGVRRPKWQLSAAGHLALLRHVDALARAGRATGWRPDPDDPVYREMRNEQGVFNIGWEAGLCGWGAGDR